MRSDLQKFKHKKKKEREIMAQKQTEVDSAHRKGKK